MPIYGKNINLPMRVNIKLDGRRRPGKFKSIVVNSQSAAKQ